MSSDHSHPGIDRTPLAPQAFRLLALRDALVARGVVTDEELDQATRALAARSPALGARLVARAWVDPGFARRLQQDLHAAAAELGIDVPAPPRITALLDTERLHHLVVCTLCSCYPRALLGRPPDWYKSLAYRSRAVREPRAVLDELGVPLEADVSVRVVDSTADHRYLVVPLPPEGALERVDEHELVGLVTRDAMIGAGRPLEA